MNPISGHLVAIKELGLQWRITLLQDEVQLHIIACNKMATNPDHKSDRNPNETAGIRAKVWTVANMLTAIRIGLMIPFLILIKEGRYGQALLVFFIASITDFADGYVARRFDQKSTLGRFLDPLADKLLTTASYIVMAFSHEGFPSIPLWLAIAVIGRDAVILAGSLLVYFAKRFTGFKPTLLGKINTFLELGLIVVFLAFHHFEVLRFLLPLCYAIVITSVVASGVEYMAQGARILKNQPKRSAENAAN